MKRDPKNPKVVLEPIEEVEIELDMEHTGGIIEKMNGRKGVLINSGETSDHRAILTFRVPSRGLLGFRTELITETRGTGIMKS